MWTRRQLLAFGAAALATGVSACSSGGSKRASRSGSTSPSVGPPDSDDGEADFSARFAEFEAADEPDADPTKVVWPDFVTDAGPEVQELYEFQLTHGEVMRYMPCFCGCGQSSGHRNNRDCYIKQVNPDGSAVFDSMAPT